MFFEEFLVLFLHNTKGKSVTDNQLHKTSTSEHSKKTLSRMGVSRAIDERIRSSMFLYKYM